jgi:hypothetical protein
VIAGVAQIVLNGADEGALAARGYAVKFAERGLASHPAKAPLQARARTRLDLVHLTPPEPGLAIEITNYEGPPAGRAAYVWDGAGVTATVSDAAASRAFWAELGFRGSDRLTFPAPLPSLRLELTLREQAGVARSSSSPAATARGRRRRSASSPVFIPRVEARSSSTACPSPPTRSC